MRHPGETTIEVFQGKNDEWYFRTKAGNGQIGDISEGYRGKTGAIRGARRWHPGVPIVLILKKPL